MCNFRHIKRDIKLTVHGDDFLVVADEEQLHWLNKVTGPDEQHSQDVKILNRTLRLTQVGIEYEADLKACRHCQGGRDCKNEEAQDSWHNPGE